MLRLSITKEHIQHKFLSELGSSCEGEVRTDLFSRQIYSVDASIYEIEPIAILLPKTKQDILTAINIASRYRIPIIPRGAATGTTGGCLGKGLILDLSKYLNKIHHIDFQEKFVICDPGVVQDQLNASLGKEGYRLGPDTSTGNRATLGGMLSNNAAGAHSLKYGRMVDHIEEVELALSTGELIRCGIDCEQSPAASLKMICQTARSVAIRCHDEIQKRFPNIPRHVSGYNLDELIKPGPLNLAKLIAGSEGTLGVVTELKLKICEKPRSTGLSVVQFKNLKEALQQIPQILAYAPFSLEVIDKKIIELGRHSPSLKGQMSWLQGNPGAILLIEFEERNPADLFEKHQGFIQWTARHKIGYAAATFYSSADQEKIWALRKAGVGLIMSRRTYSRAIAFVEDLAVAPEKLSLFIDDFEKCLLKHQMEAGFYGHAGPGCIHVRPFVDLRRPAERLEMKAVMEEMADVLLSYGGSLSGEHGDGLIRSWLNEKMFGPLIFQAFKEIKKIFDPHGIMNPGKIVPNQDVLENLRPPIVNHIPTFLDFSREGGFGFAVNMCNGNGQCRKKEGLMCPTFQADGDEYHSTRARAQSLRAIVNGKAPLHSFTSNELYNVLELCIECKGCKSECPSQVDMAKMKSEFLYHYQKKHGTSLRSRLFGHIGYVNQLGSFLAPLSNRLIQSSLSKYLLEKIGITSQRPLPPFSPERFSKWIGKQKQQAACSNEVAAIPAKKNNEPPNGAKAYRPGEGSPVRGDAPLGKKELAGIADEVVLFCDTYTEFNTPSIGKAAFALLQRLGYRIHTPGWACCGRPLFSKGLLKEAHRQANKTIDLLHPFVEREMPIIVLEPSCLSIFIDDYKDLISHPWLPRLAGLCLSLEEFLQRHLLDPRFLSLFSPDEKTIAFHSHCHQKALARTANTLRVLQAMPGARVIEIPSGCCGMAGSFGYEKEHYDFSLKIGEDRLFPAIRSLPPQTQLLASGTSCRSQISHGTGVQAKHLAEVLLYHSSINLTT